MHLRITAFSTAMIKMLLFLLFLSLPIQSWKNNFLTGGESIILQNS